MSFDEWYEDEEYNFSPTPEFMQNFATRKATELGLDPEITSRMIGAESNWNPNAVSPAGARGLAQLMPATAADEGIDINNPIKNLAGGIGYLDKQYEKFGNYPEALAAYNAGAGNVQKYGGVPPFKETQNYVSKILGSEIPQAPNIPSSLSRSALPTPNRRLADLAAANEEIAGLEALQRSALGQMGKGQNLSEGNTLAVALTALLPALIGMGMHGKEGAAMGFNAGAAGAGVGLQGFANEAKEKSAANDLMYKDASTQLAAKRGELKGIRDSIADREEKNAEAQYFEAGRNARSKLHNTTQKDINQKPLSKEAREGITAKARIAAQGADVIDFITKETPELLNERYYKPDGTIDFEGAGEIILNRFGKVMGPESASGRATQKIEQFLSGYQKEMSGLAATDKEFARLYGQLYEKGFLDGQFLPTAMPTALRTIQEFIKKQEKLALNDINIDRAIDAGDPEGVRGLFDSARRELGNTPQAPQIPTGARSITFADGSKGYYFNNKAYTLDGKEAS